MTFDQKMGTTIGVMVFACLIFFIGVGYAVGQQSQKESNIKENCQITTLQTEDGKAIYYCEPKKPKA